MTCYSFDRDVLQAAQYELEKAGFQVSSATPDLLAGGVAFAAYRERDDFGALIAFSELGHIKHYGAVYLWGGNLESNPKPFQARDVRSKLESFVARVCLSVSSTAPGQGARQAELSKAAFSVGGLVEGHGVDSEAFKGQLEEAGFACGLEPHRVKATVQTSFRAGVRKPWMLEDKPVFEKQKAGIASKGSAFDPLAKYNCKMAKLRGVR